MKKFKFIFFFILIFSLSFKNSYSNESIAILDLDGILEKTNLPTLFIKGENSSYITIDDYQEVKRYFPLSNIKIVKNAGHWVHAEEPIKFFKVVVDFLKEE